MTLSLSIPAADSVATSTAAAVVVDLLVDAGVDAVFGVPGGAIEPLLDALALAQGAGGPQIVIARHEAGAAFMADGYARETGRLGVCFATSGPGATNLLTGIACSHANEIPVLAITGQPALSLHGRNALQESGDTGIDVTAMFKHCTRYNTMVTDPLQAETKAIAAIGRALQQPHGPTHLSVPVDVLRAPVARRTGVLAFPGMVGGIGLPRSQAIDELAESLAAAERAVIVAGRGASQALREIESISEMLAATVVTTPDAKGLVDPQHEQVAGVIGFAGHAQALEAVAHADLVLLVGSRVSEWTTAAWSADLLGPKLIHVDASAENLLLSPMSRQQVNGDPAVILAAVDARLRQSREPASRRFRRLAPDVRESVVRGVPGDLDPGAPVSPDRLMDVLSVQMPSDARLVADAGNATAWAIHCLDRPRGVERPLRHPWIDVLTEFAPMGWAIGASVGMAAGEPSQQIVCLTGDGSWLMNGQEITTAIQHELSVVFVILNDAALGMVKHGQRLAGAQRVGYDLPEIDYAAIAQAMGCRAHVVGNVRDLDALDWQSIFDPAGPVLLDVRIDAECVPPMALRLDTLNRA